jgi:hypothetical protein
MRLHEPGARDNPQFVVEPLPDLFEHGQRGGSLPPGGEREHRPGVHPLVERFMHGQCPRLRQYLLRAACRGGGRRMVQGHQRPLLRQADHRRMRAHRAHVVQRLTSP